MLRRTDKHTKCAQGDPRKDSNKGGEKKGERKDKGIDAMGLPPTVGGMDQVILRFIHASFIVGSNLDLLFNFLTGEHREDDE